MKSRLMVFIHIVFVFSLSNIYSHDVNNIPALPSNAQLEAYTENEELYAEKLFEYYNLAVEYNTLLKEREVTSRSKINIPSNEELTSPDINTIKKYYKIAQDLKNQFDAIPKNNTISKLKKYRNVIDSLRTDNERLKSEIYDFSLDENNTPFYKKLSDKLIEDNAKDKFIEDSINLNRLDRMKKSYDNLKKLYTDSYATSTIMMSTAFCGSRVYFGSSSVKTDPGFNLGLNINAGPIFGFGKVIEIFGNYTSFKLKYDDSFTNTQIEYSANMFHIGAQYILKDLFKLDDFKANVALGTGFFFGDARTPNLNGENLSFKGNFLKAELSFRNINYNFPLELFINYTANSHSNDLIFVLPNSNSSITNPSSEILSIGARFNIWRSIDN